MAGPSSSAGALSPAEAIGAQELRQRTNGGRGVTIGVLEGPPQLSHPCLAGADITVIEPWWLPPTLPIDITVDHGTYVASVLFGQPGTAVEGLTPAARGVFVATSRDEATLLDPLNVARGIETLLEHGADVILVCVAHPTISDDVAWPVKRAIEAAAAAGVLVVAGAGNDEGRCRNALAVLPQVLVVGAHRNDGVMFKFSNWGTAYRGHGIVAPGDAVLGATPDGGTAPHKGTSISIALMAGVAALLISARQQAGLGKDPLAVGQALLRTARPCGPSDSHGRPERCLDGKLDLPAATSRALTGGQVLPSAARPPDPRPSRQPVYALGALGYDFGTEARRDTFKQLMPPVRAGVPANPYDPRQMIGYLHQQPSEAHALIWTLNLDLTPVYAVEPVGGYAPEVHTLLVQFLARQLAPMSEDGFAERISVPGMPAGRTVQLLSGQVLPVLEITGSRGLYAWSVPALARALGRPGGPHGDALQDAVADFLQRVYHDLRNLGSTPRERALNFAATNAVQARDVLAEALQDGMALHDIEVSESPYGRFGSDVCDVRLRFFDPRNSRRAKRVYRYTIDVTDVMPVTISPTRTWIEA
ncbi:S8 family serine peptidase [Nonomuraea rhizosphaerae]|uniref:cyanobactin maturation protease PatG family protein n=1 Tax=Nonomuraea rhizosphaerae TaxID=2665663 RepID=UPI001C5F47C1|nr:S8 family serine peptidase [Nonomuraea rhizosphaerae]